MQSCTFVVVSQKHVVTLRRKDPPIEDRPRYLGVEPPERRHVPRRGRVKEGDRGLLLDVVPDTRGLVSVALL